MSLSEAAVTIPRRRHFSFSADGRRLARISDADGVLAVEVLELTCSPPALRRVGHELQISRECQLLCTDMGMLLAHWYGDAFSVTSLESLQPRDSDPSWTVHRVCELPVRGLRLLPHVPQAGWHMLVSWDDDDRTTLWRVEWPSRKLSAVGTVSGLTTGGVWLDGGRHLALNIVGPEGRISAWVLDISTGSRQLAFRLSSTSNDTIVLAHPATRTVVVATDAFGGTRLGAGRLGGTEQVRFLPSVGVDDSPIAAALDDGGRQLLVRSQQGTSSELWLADLGEGVLVDRLDVPAGDIGLPVLWRGSELLFPFSSSTTPRLCARYSLVEQRFALVEASDLGDFPQERLRPAETMSFPTRWGELDVLVYAADVAPAAGTVVALHGGPFSQWCEAFYADLQMLAALGWRVIAPNPRGSTGYGREFSRALHGRAGVADLEDVLTVAKAVAGDTTGGRSLILYGTSYGAFLALLAAASAPELAHGVIAVAPFTSFSSLHVGGRPDVRQLIELIIGTDRGEDHITTRLRCPVLIVHGAEDSLIPVEEARALVGALQEASRAGVGELRYLELPGQGHVFTAREARLRVHRAIVEFLDSVAAGRPETAAVPT